jgi:copper(I)-binding protein
MLLPFALLACSSLGEGPPIAPQVQVTDVRTRALPPTARNGAAFMTLRNAGPDSALVGATATVSRAVELHTHTEVDGMMQMRQVPEIPLPSGEDVVMKPGGLHVMLLGLTQPMTEGERFPLVLRFADGSEKEVVVPVEVGNR